MARVSFTRALGCPALLGIGLLLSSVAAAQTADASLPAMGEANEADSSLRFGGYAKTLLIDSRTLDAAAEPYTLSLNRLRLKMTYDVPSRFQVHIEHDTEARAGSYLDTAAFAQEKNAPARQYWNDGSVFADSRRYYGTQRLFRAYARLSGEAVDVTIGRQRIPLGSGRMWSALDMLNPVNPLQVERDEYVGVDAALLDYKIGALSKVSAVYAPDPAQLSNRWVTQYKTNVEGTDLAFTYGKYWDNHIVGVDFTTQIGDAGLHGELTYTKPQTGPAYGKMLLGFDYAFANTFTLSAETYYSSQTQQDRLAQFAQNPQLAQVEPFGSRYAGLAVSYDFTPLLKASMYCLYSVADHSRFVSPTLSYSITDNLMILGGSQFFSGGNGSDYGRGRNLHYMQLQYFF